MKRQLVSVIQPDEDRRQLRRIEAIIMKINALVKGEGGEIREGLRSRAADPPGIKRGKE